VFDNHFETVDSLDAQDVLQLQQTDSHPQLHTQTAPLLLVELTVVQTLERLLKFLHNRLLTLHDLGQVAFLQVHHGSVKLPVHFLGVLLHLQETCGIAVTIVRLLTQILI